MMSRPDAYNGCRTRFGSDGGEHDDGLVDIQGLLPQELEAWMLANDTPAFRARQIQTWLYRHGAESFDRMNTLPAALRKALKQSFRCDPWREIDRREAADGTVKRLLRACDGIEVETVIIPSSRRHTLCVSSQAGCAFGCKFCATAQGGFKRNLGPGEIVAQATHAANGLGGRPDNIVFMGMGEPFDNYDSVLKAVRIFNDPGCFGVGARRITLSTCGVVPGMDRLADEGLQVELSVSLHAADDTLRDRIMPVNRKWPLNSLIEACRRYVRRTNRIITFEYTLIQGLNDHPRQAEALVRRLAGLRCRFNLIPLSPTAGFEGKGPESRTVYRFMNQLTRSGINTTVRRSKGDAVDGACGQLRLRQGNAEG